MLPTHSLSFGTYPLQPPIAINIPLFFYYSATLQPWWRRRHQSATRQLTSSIATGRLCDDSLAVAAPVAGAAAAAETVAKGSVGIVVPDARASIAITSEGVDVETAN